MKKLSIANRIQMSFVAAIGMVLIIGFLSFYYINKLNSGLQRIVDEDIRLARLTEEIKNTSFEIFKTERRFALNTRDTKLKEELEKLTISLNERIIQAKGVSRKAENIERYDKMSDFALEYLSIMKNIDHSSDLTADKNKLRDRLIKISNLNRAVLQDRYKELEAHQGQVNQLSSDAQRNMIIVVLLMLLSGLGLGFVAPNVVVTPFKKMVQAINEVRTGKLNISIPVEADDEIGTIAKSLNTMIHELREFDEMKVKRIAFEKRRFETLANMVDYGVMVLKREGVIEFINSQLYLLLHCDTKEIEGYRIEHTPLPQEIKDFLELCLETKEKIDGKELTIHIKQKSGETLSVALLADTSMVRTHDGTIVNIIITFEEKKAHVEKAYLARHVSKKEDQSAVN